MATEGGTVLALPFRALAPAMPAQNVVYDPLCMAKGTRHEKGRLASSPTYEAMLHTSRNTTSTCCSRQSCSTEISVAEEPAATCTFRKVNRDCLPRWSRRMTGMSPI